MKKMIIKIIILTKFSKICYKKTGGELVFQKMNITPEIMYKNMTEFNQVFEQY